MDLFACFVVRLLGLFGPTSPGLPKTISTASQFVTKSAMDNEFGLRGYYLARPQFQGSAISAKDPTIGRKSSRCWYNLRIRKPELVAICTAKGLSSSVARVVVIRESPF